jgi:hypothetical protein
MVVVVLSPHKPGAHSRTFPFTGYLGYSPVSIQGAIRTKVEEDGLLLEARDIRVRARCYELDRSAAVARKPTVVCEFENVVWSASDGEYEPLGNFSSAFRIVIPPEAARSVPSTLAYKSWRVWWCLEGGMYPFYFDPFDLVINMGVSKVVNHRPSGMFGSRIVRSHHLAFLRYGAPTLEPFRPWTDADSHSSPIDYVVSADSSTYAAGDNVSVSLSLRRSPRYPAASIKKIVLEIKRELHIGSSAAAAASSDVSLGATSSPPNNNRNSTEAIARPARRVSGWSLFSRSSAIAPQSPAYPSPRSTTSSTSSTAQEDGAPSSSYFCLPSKRSSTPLGNRREEVVLATAARDAEVAFDPEGVWNGRIDCLLPKRRSLYRYSIGESVSTPGAAMRFFVCVRVRAFLLFLRHRQCP